MPDFAKEPLFFSACIVVPFLVCCNVQPLERLLLNIESLQTKLV